MFYVAPLFLIALLLWVQLGAPRPRPVAAASVAVGAALLVATLPFARLHRREVDVRHARAPALVEAAGARAQRCTRCGSSRRSSRSAPRRSSSFVPQRWALVLPLLVLAYFAVVQQPVAERRAELASRNARAARAFARSAATGSTGAVRRRRRRRRRSGRASTDAHVVWENEFFNRSVGPVYDVAQPIPGQPRRRRPVRVGPTASLRGRALRSDLRAQRRHARPARRAARVRRRKRRQALGVVAPPFARVTQVTGLYPNGNWSGPVGRLSPQPSARAAAVRVDAARRPEPLPRPQTVRANGVTYDRPPGRPDRR